MQFSTGTRSGVPHLHNEGLGDAIRKQGPRQLYRPIAAPSVHHHNLGPGPNLQVRMLVLEGSQHSGSTPSEQPCESALEGCFGAFASTQQGMQAVQWVLMR